jgi:hypothetical protein
MCAAVFNKRHNRLVLRTDPTSTCANTYGSTYASTYVSAWEKRPSVAQMLCKRLKIGFFSLTLIGDLSKVAAVQQGIWFRRFLSLIITVQQNIGDVSEWLKEHAWKVCIRQRIESSNLSVTAIFE